MSPIGVSAFWVRYELGLFRGGTCLGVADAAGPRGPLPAESAEYSGHA